MRNLVPKTKSVYTLFLIVGVLLFSSCKNNSKGTANNEANLKKEEVTTEEATVNQKLLLGSWEDSSKAALHFSILKNGVARSDNMRTLLYKKWSVDENRITFIIESIGNATSSIDTVTYTIEKLTDDKMVLRKGAYLSEYTKK